MRNLSDEEQMLYNDLMPLLPGFEVATEAPLVVAPCLASKDTSDCHLCAPLSIVIHGVIDGMLSALANVVHLPTITGCHGQNLSCD